MYNRKEFRVINSSVVFEDLTRIETLIVELAECERFQIPGSGITSRKFDVNNTRTFVFIKDSVIAKQILELPEIIVVLNLSEFTIQITQIGNKEKVKVYFHNEFIAERDKISGCSIKDLILNPELRNAIDECVLYHHTDMHFNFIFRHIIIREYEDRFGPDTVIDMKDLYDKYLQLTAIILKDAGNIESTFLRQISDLDRKYYTSKFADAINYTTTYKNVIAGYVIHRVDSIKEIIVQELNDDTTMYPMFSSLCILDGYKISLDRIKRNLNKKAFFDHEIKYTKNKSVIKLFLTPHGFLRKNELVSLAEANKLDDAIDDYFKGYGILRIQDAELSKKLNTKYIFKHEDDDQIFYYKRRIKNWDYVPFGEQNRKHPLSALLGQGQMNLTSTDSSIDKENPIGFEIENPFDVK